MEWLASEIVGLFVSIGKDPLAGFWNKIKLFQIKRKLSKNLFQEILDKYGNREYYNDLDCFLSSKNVFQNVIANSESTQINLYKSRSQLLTYYVQLFLEEKPNYIQHKSEMLNLIQRCFEVIFNTLNDDKSNESIRKISNIAKELAGEISFDLTEIKTELSEVNAKINILMNNIGKDQNEQYKVSFEQYFEYLTRVFLQYKKGNFYPRYIYSKDNKDKNIVTLDALLKNKQILLLGEAGYGKTYESVAVLGEVLRSSRATPIIPFYLPLHEYGVIYSSIFEGIQYKLKPFVQGNISNLVVDMMSSKQILLILDGIDDIQQQDNRNKFISEVKNFSLQFSQSYLFITSRNNRYHDELGNIYTFYLKGLNKEIINEKLKAENINTKIPEDYYQLFENPMYFGIGKTILKQNQHRELFNRSILFEEIMTTLCGEWDKRKGVATGLTLSYSETLSLFGAYAFDTFNQHATRLLEFDDFISNHIRSDNKSVIINTLLRSGVLLVDDKISFSHKLLKEFCAAYHLVQNYPLLENMPKYLDYIKREDWKEVFIFASGMFKSIEQQDEFLDFILYNNIQLYIDCINAKSDLSSLINSNNEEYAKRFLSQIVKTYSFMVDKYFQSIKHNFTPRSDINVNFDSSCIC